MGVCASRELARIADRHGFLAHNRLTMVKFVVPEMADQPEGWGPELSAVPPGLEGVPYAPYNKSERIGRAADFTQQGYKYGQWI